MNEKEFKRWFNDYRIAFPNITAYLSRVENPKETLASWYEVLKKYDVVYLVLVKDQMVYGNLEPLQAHESGLFAHHIRAYVKKLISDRIREKDRERVRLPSVSNYLQEDNSTSNLLRWANAALAMCRAADKSQDAEREIHQATIMVNDESASETERQAALAVLEKHGTSVDAIRTYLDTNPDSMLNGVDKDGCAEEEPRAGEPERPERDRAPDTREAPASREQESDPAEEPFDW